MVIEAAMLAGTHWLNAALHRQAITASGDDVMHAEYMTVALRTRTRLILPGLVEALDEVEQLRPFFVRGDISGGQKAAERCIVLLGILQAGTEANAILPPVHVRQER